MNDYEKKKQERIDRYRERADAARAQSNALAKQSHDMIHAIPMGQPIMSAADARYRERAGNKMRQAIAADEKAAYTALSDVTGNEPATYNCVGTSDGIAPYTTMQNRLNRLSGYGIPTEFHAYDGLPHGFGLGTGTVAEGWLKDAVAFWEANM